MPSPQLVGYNVIYPPARYVNAIGNPYKNRVTWAESLTITSADIPAGLVENDNLLMFIVASGGTNLRSATPFTGLSDDWLLVKQTFAPGSPPGTRVIGYWSAYNPEMVPFTLVPRGTDGNVAQWAIRSGWLVILAGYEEGQESGTGGGYSSLSPDQLIYGNATSTERFYGTTYAEGTNVGVASATELFQRVTLDSLQAEGFVEQFSRDGIRNGCGGVTSLGLVEDGLLWLNCSAGFLAVDPVNYEVVHSTPAITIDSPLYATSSIDQEVGIAVDTANQRAWRLTRSGSSSLGSTPNAVQLWDISTMPATLILQNTYTNSPDAVLKFPQPDPDDDHFLVIERLDFTSTSLPVTVREYDKDASLIRAWVMTGVANLSNAWVIEEAGVPYLFTYNGALRKLNLATLTPAGVVSGFGGTGKSIYAHGAIWLASRDFDSIKKINPVTMTLTSTLSVPTANQLAADDNFLYVGTDPVFSSGQPQYWSTKVRKFDPVTLTQIAVGNAVTDRHLICAGGSLYGVASGIQRINTTTLVRDPYMLDPDNFACYPACSLIDRQFATPYTGTGPRWRKAPTPFPSAGAATFLSFNGQPLEQGGWMLGMLGV